MAGMMDANQQFLVRTDIWSRQIKELLLDELNAMKFVRILSDYMINIFTKLFNYVSKGWSE